MDDDLGPLLRAVLDEPVVIRVRHDLGPAQRRLLDRLGATVVVDPAAPVCDRFCGRQECAVSARTNARVSALGLGMASLGSGGGIAWEPNWIDFRHSLVLVDKRRDLGEVPATCDACGCETDVTPAPHSPKCPTLARSEWTRDGMLEAVEVWAVGHEDAPPLASDWTKETTAHPSARQAVVEFSSWTGFLEEAGFSASTPRRRGRRLGPPVDGRELLERMDAGEPLKDEPELEEAAAVGKRAESGSAPLLVGEPERAAVSSSPEPGPAEPAPTPEGEERRPAGGGASTNGHGNLRWTREKVIAAIREVAEKVGHTPSRKEMLAHGYGAVPQKNVTDRLGTTWSELVREAGYEPLTRADGVQRRVESSGRAARPAPATRKGNTAAHPTESEREPKATDPAEAEVAPSRRPLLAAEATSRSDVLLRAVALAARAFADAILEEA